MFCWVRPHYKHIIVWVLGVLCNTEHIYCTRNVQRIIIIMLDNLHTFKMCYGSDCKTDFIVVDPNTAATQLPLHH